MLKALFPFRNTYQRLDLASQWWHRLAIALYIIIVCGFTVFMIAHEVDRDREANLNGKIIWGRLMLLDSPSVFDTQTNKDSKRHDSQEITKEMLAADGRLPKEIFWDYPLGVLYGVLVSYTLQFIYRLGIYVKFGASLQE